MNEIISKLKFEGWFINETKLLEYIQNNNVVLNGYNAVKQFLLNTDIKNYGDTWLDISNKNELECRGVLQVSKTRNVSIPEIEQDSGVTIGLYKYTVSDGVTSIFLLDLQATSQLSKGVDVGSKVVLRGTVPFKSGMLLVTDSVSLTCLGGKVIDLIRSESVQKASRSTRSTAIGKGAPKFIPFGNKLNINIQEIKKFRAMKVENNEDVDDSLNSEFGEKREAALAEVRKAKGSDSAALTNKNVLLDKFHGGATSKFIKSTTEKQGQADADLSNLMSYGFNFTESRRALQTANNDVKIALDSLMKQRVDSQMNISSERGRGRGRRGRGNRRGKGDSDGDDSWFDPAQFAEQVGLASRPNTTTSLAELMGPRATASDTKSVKENNYFNPGLVKRGFECLAQVMDGSYQPAVVLDVLPNKCIKIRYHDTGDVIDTTAQCLKTVTGEKIYEHMVPIVTEPLSLTNSRTTASGNYTDYRNDNGYRGRGRPSRRRGGGRYGRSY